MNNISRVFATGFIWAALTILGVSMMVTHIDVSSGTLAFMMSMLVIGATIGTASIWKGGDSDKDIQRSSEKAKRRSRVERLMNDLDDRDIDELRYRLMNPSDDEVIPLEELINKGQGR